MKVEELQAILDKLDRAISQITGILVRQAYRMPLAELEEVYRDLDQHRLEMEAAETANLLRGDADIKAERLSEHACVDSRLDCQTRSINAHRARLDKIENRLDEIPASFRRAISAHFYDQRERLDEIEKTVHYLDIGCDAGLERIKRRLAEIERPAPPVPFIEVEMRVKGTTFRKWFWQARIAGAWFTTHDREGIYNYDSREDAQIKGHAWLKRLGDDLGVKLAPKWGPDAEKRKDVNDE